MDQREKIIQLIRLKGPVIPSQISKEIDRDILFTSAMLSELVDEKKLKLSYVKVGGSPVYYLPTQSGLLQTLYNRLNSKQKGAYDILKQNKVLRDRALQPVERVALRDLKDFAFPLQVKIGEKTEIFWKWYLITNQEASLIIKDILETKKVIQEGIQKSELQKAGASESNEQKQLEVREKETTAGTIKTSEIKTQTTIKSFDRSSKSSEEIMPKTEIKEPGSSQFTAENETSEINKTKKQDIKNKIPEGEEEKIIEQVRKMMKKEKRKKGFISKLVNGITGFGKEEKEEQKVLAKPEIKDPFLDKLKRFFEENKIKLIEFNIIRKKSEIDFMLMIPSAVGEITYYCKAKNKKKCNDGDLSSAFVQGQSKKLPILFITTGDLTKRAKEMLNKEFKNISFKKIK